MEVSLRLVQMEYIQVTVGALSHPDVTAMVIRALLSCERTSRVADSLDRAWTAIWKKIDWTIIHGDRFGGICIGIL